MNNEETKLNETIEENATSEKTREETAEAVQSVEAQEAVAEAQASSEQAENAAPEVQEEAAPKEAEVKEEKAESVEASPESKEESNTNEAQHEEIFQELKQKSEQNESFEAEIKSRIRGGLRAYYKEMPLFLPASHYTLKRTPTEEELNEAVGKKVQVAVHEMQELEGGRKAVIISRKNLLMDEFWGKINEGDKVEGKVTSIASFGVFLDLGGVEGLIHISRLSQAHVDNPANIVKKGQTIEAIVVEIDKERNRIALSRKELEESPWQGVSEEFESGKSYKGIVRRITDFGVYIEMKPGVDGLLRTGEISWTKRVKNPGDMFKSGDEIELKVLSVSEGKQNMALSLKQMTDNPWEEMKERFAVNTELDGKVVQVMPQGAIVEIAEDVDGFMPRSKMRDVMKGKKIPYNPGEEIKVLVADIVPEDESLILAPVVDEATLAENQARQQRREKPRQESTNKSTFTLGDLLEDALKQDLIDKAGD